MTLLDGKLTSKKLRARFAAQVQEHEKLYGKKPGLAVILVGNNPASQTYVKNKELACEEVGFYSEVHRLPEETTQEELLSLIEQLNRNENIHGILVQLPVPRHIDETTVIEAIDPKKDVDAFGYASVGRIMVGNPDFLPCTPAGVMALLEEYDIPVEGKNAVVIGRSNIVGKPQAMLLLHKNATVTICHSKTKNLEKITREADILVVAIGRAKFVGADMVKDGAVVIDVGMNRDENGKLCGDVDFDAVKDKAAFITPVPGGCGPMTITMLLQNTLTAAKNAK